MDNTFCRGDDFVAVEKRDGCLRVTLPQEITMYNIGSIEESVAANLCDGENHVLFDFAKTRTVYSSALAMMVRIRRFVVKRGGSVKFVNVCDHLYEVFTTANIDRIFTISRKNGATTVVQGVFAARQEAIPSCSGNRSVCGAA